MNLEPQEAAAIVKPFIKEIASYIDVEAEVSVWEDEAGLHVDIWGDDVALLIGRRGSTLEAIQILCSAALRRQGLRPMRVLLDIEHYKAKRREKLTERTLRLAERVKTSGRMLRMDPMSAEERKTVHEALKDDAAVETWSEGAEPERNVVIGLAGSGPDATSDENAVG
ncbi:MAG: Jag family protein [Candidatus Geothermincolia bacterium]